MLRASIPVLITLVAFITSDGLASLSTAPSSQPAAQLYMPTKLTYVVHAYASFAPGDATIVFQSNATGNWDLYVMRIDGSGLRQITTDRAADITPVYSPDGKRIAFVSERDGNREVYVCDADGSNPKRITRDPAQDIHPVWSAGGKKIMFSSNRGNSNADDYDIYEMNADGTDVQRITSGAEIDTYSSRSPDGTKLVTRRVIDGNNNEVFVLDADGSNPRNLTNDPTRYDGWPVWSPDGKRIAFASGIHGRDNHAIYLINADGTNRVQLTHPLPGLRNFMYNTQPIFSHDGKKLIYTMYRPGMRESSELLMIDVPDA
jgi:TolB protein